MTTASIFSAAPAYPAAGPGAGDEYSIVIARSTPTLVVIAGPTGVGKSALALELAETLGGEIISADSRQVYHGLEIGTAQPERAELARVRHHLVGILAPDQPFSAADFVHLAGEALRGIAARRGVAFVVGGTYHYVQALLDRLDLPRVPPRWSFRQEL